MTKPVMISAAPPAKKRWSAPWPLALGFATIAVLVGTLGLWSVQARIAGAVISLGMIQVESNRQVIQHPTGGVVGEILAEDGDVVEAGDVVVRFDDARAKSELAIVESQLFEVMARRARLEAERDGTDGLDMPRLLAEATTARPEVAALVEGQARLFETRAESLAQEAGQLREQIVQSENQIAGAEAQLVALRRQADIVAGELVNNQSLFDRGLIEVARVTEMQREHARLLGEIGNLEATVAQLKGQIAGLNIERLRLETSRREEAIATLRDIGYRELELKERRLQIIETLSRLDARAPVGGTIYGSTVFALRSVVSPAEPMMYVIPDDAPLVVVSRIDAIHIDQVHVGQEVSLRFTAFDQRLTPEILGTVRGVSADVFLDEATGLSYYRAELLPNEGEVDKLGDVALLPGMPVEAFLKTGERSPLSYLAKPLTDYFRKAFRET